MVVVKDGYEMLALVNRGDNHFDAIIDRKSKFQPFVVCLNYDITDGTWAQGEYFEKYEIAKNYLADRMRNE
jgi:hypothetical protein